MKDQIGHSVSIDFKKLLWPKQKTFEIIWQELRRLQRLTTNPEFDDRVSSCSNKKNLPDNSVSVCLISKPLRRWVEGRWAALFKVGCPLCNSSRASGNKVYPWRPPWMRSLFNTLLPHLLSTRRSNKYRSNYLL